MKSNDGVKKVSSAHPAVNQIEYQVEVLYLVRSCPLSFVIAYLKIALGALRIPAWARRAHAAVKNVGQFVAHD